ncbi:MAG: UPF0164 family protein [Treponema sp.]|jgi:hypothetical protein|nr:UPF0164 family protein [Treponema sp.]
MIRSKITVVFIVLLVFFSFSPIFAERQDTYGNIADYLSRIYGIDNNAGLTTFPVLNIPMGGRSEGMIAFLAVSDDVSFIEVNPAGSSMLEKSELAFFHNNWIADTKIEGVAYATRYGNLGVAAGARILYTPFTEYNLYGDRVSGGYYSEGVAILNASYNFLSGYYFSGVSLGMNLKGAYRLMPDYFGSNDNLMSGLDQSAVMAMVDIGVLTRFNFLKPYSSREKNASAAFVIKNLGPPAMGEPLPTSAGFGISYKPIRPLTFGLDFFMPVNLMDISYSELPYGSFGFSINVTNCLSMRGGFMYKAGSSRVSVGSVINLEKIAVDINYTLDLLTQLQPLNRVSLGVRFDLGDGGRSYTSNKVDELYLLGMEAYSRGYISDARLCWEEALRINPRYDPAREGLAMLNDREELMQRIEELHRLDF